MIAQRAEEARARLLNVYAEEGTARERPPISWPHPGVRRLPKVRRAIATLSENPLVEDDPPDASLIIERYYQIGVVGIVEEVDSGLLGSSHQVYVCSVIQRVYIVPSSRVVLVCVPPLHKVEHTGVEQFLDNGIPFEVSWK